MGEAAGRWFGAACAGEALVATAVGATREETVWKLRRSLPRDAERSVPDDARPGYARRVLALLAELEAGEESGKAFSLAIDYVPGPLARVLTVAARIPIGYVTTYGAIAKATGTEARFVGGAMASNPLYPIVPCHRVLGADLSLVGYGGRKGEAALRAKLARLSAEVRGFTAERDVEVADASLRVSPVEWAIAKAGSGADDRSRQLTLFPS